jgi:hypothetical protein
VTHTHALFADQSQSILDNLLALLGQSSVWNCSDPERSDLQYEWARGRMKRGPGNVRYLGQFGGTAASNMRPPKSGHPRTSAVRMATGIASQRWERATVHLNAQIVLTREQHADYFFDTIIEGPHDWVVPPVSEAFYERDVGQLRTRSALIGAIWQVQDNIAVDFAVRGARVNDHSGRDPRRRDLRLRRDERAGHLVRPLRHGTAWNALSLENCNGDGFGSIAGDSGRYSSIATRPSAYIVAVVAPEERPAAASITAVPKTFAWAADSIISGYLLTLCWPLLIGGVIKGIHDILLLLKFQKVHSSEEARAAAN